ncbi:MAG: tyrosine-protein phosphatase [Alphaproteobacteria bacterium]|nr:tyrosine-protein phosphatase [Alphaproteobacteria bacterium]
MDASSAARPSASKVAAVTSAFWIMKICATTVGETGGDMVSMTMNVGYAASSLILLSVFGLALAAQLRARSFHPFLYWTVVLATSTAGTTISDYMDRTLDLGYAAGAALLSATLVAVLLIWRRSVGSLSVSDIRTPRVEAFYWTAILVSNTLGTAVGDFLADSSGLGYVGSNLLISGAIAAIAAGYFFTSLSRTGLFWGAFVLTRPFGATMGDMLTKSPAKGGLGIGTVGASAVLLAILVICILVTSRPANTHRAAPRGKGWRRFWLRMATAVALLVSVPAGYRAYLYFAGNFHVVAEGEVYRAAQPTPERLADWAAAYHLKSVLNLRGHRPGKAWYDAEVTAAKQLGVTLIDYPLSADIVPTAAQVADLIEILAKAPKPLLIHCKEGADRAGFVSAVYLAAIAGADEDTAEAQLSFRFGHVSLPFIPSYAMDEGWEAAGPALGFAD